MILFVMFLVDWEDPWCRTSIGKVCLYVNLPISSTLYVLALSRLLPDALQQSIDRDCLIWWQGLTLCLVSPLALWWEYQSNLQGSGLPLEVKDRQNEKSALSVEEMDAQGEKQAYIDGSLATDPCPV